MPQTIVPAVRRSRLPHLSRLTVTATGALALGAGLLAATPLTAHAPPSRMGQ